MSTHTYVKTILTEPARVRCLSGDPSTDVLFVHVLARAHASSSNLEPAGPRRVRRAALARQRGARW